MKNAPKNFLSEPYSYHQEVELTIDTLTNLGVGLGRIDGWVVMVAFALPGERVRARVFRNHKNYSEADLVEVLEASRDRVDPVCSLFAKCGGCQYQHLSYEAQLRWKQSQVEELFEKALSTPVSVKPTWGSPKQYHYRSKLTPHYPRPKSDDFPIGFLRYGQQRAIVDVPQCPIAMEVINQKLPEVREQLREHSKKIKRGGTLLFRAAESGVETDARETITERIDGKAFQFEAGSFFQNNPYILKDFVHYALNEAGKTGLPYLVDAYCGVGVFSICASERFERCLGVEVSASAVRWANGNLKINNISNCEYIVGAAESIFSEITFPAEKTAVLIDPPRKGCDLSFLEQLCAYGPERLVYVSCDPSTQARDLQLLTQRGYTIESVQPFDLFPQTRHIETIVTLAKV